MRPSQKGREENGDKTLSSSSPISPPLQLSILPPLQSPVQLASVFATLLNRATVAAAVPTAVAAAVSAVVAASKASESSHCFRSVFSFELPLVLDILLGHNDALFQRVQLKPMFQSIAKRYRELQGLNKQETADRYEKEQIEPQLLSEKNVMIAAHGNSLRSIIFLSKPIGRVDGSDTSDGVAVTERVVKKVTYKDLLLTISVPRLEGIPDIDLDDDMAKDDLNPEDRWYQENNDPQENVKEFDPCPIIPISKEEFENWCKPWKNVFIVKLLGKRVGLAFIEQQLKRDWVKNGTIDVIHMDRDYFLVHFSDDEGYSHALTEGPWMIVGHYVVVQRWRPSFLTSEDIVRKIAIWIHIPNLPIELYNQRFLWRVGSAIGHMLKIDHTTSIHLRGKFARICVKIDLAKILVPRISMLDSELNIEYEGLHQIYFSCEKYGHWLDSCYENLGGQMSSQLANLGGGEMTGEGVAIDGEGDQKENNNAKINAQEPRAKDFMDFGPWMLEKKLIRWKKDISFPKKKRSHYDYDSNSNMEREANQESIYLEGVTL
ncbi:hypothetical protein Ahy_B02g060933 isoform B [Arachis hypogaea]|uniref:DUF4283 domain-containing protein n=1 Tax=Arachis hypogaea TaxID=3818 RepID=A0A445AJP1_ARAHY|nr:hypothetical protein Ahy_B02g060933 isoform B [Arachis hypogaea]